MKQGSGDSKCVSSQQPCQTQTNRKAARKECRDGAELHLPRPVVHADGCDAGGDRGSIDGHRTMKTLGQMDRTAHSQPAPPRPNAKTPRSIPTVASTTHTHGASMP